MIEFVLHKIENRGLISKKGDEISIVDIGTGNGHLLFELHEAIVEEGLDQDIIFHFEGIDYSEKSVAFAKSVAPLNYSDGNFEFERVDILSKNCEYLENKNESIDIVLDKGTLDAIALNQEPLPDFNNQIGMDIYASQVSKLMHSGSILLITSCNFTKDELIKIITRDDANGLSVSDEISYPSFQFGGVKGSTICSVAFRKL